jgi:hypothetical protein
MSSQKELAFDIKPVLGEINSIIQKEVQKILRKFLEKYSTYEETHNLVMNIPAVKKLRNAKEMFLATSGQRDDLSTTIQEFYRKIQSLTKENDSLKRELNKYKSEEHISLKISETDRVTENAECDEKMYEKILDLTDSSSKKVLMNNMFKVKNEKEESDDSDSEEESTCYEDEGYWKCKDCFYKNNMSEIKCEKCFSSKETNEEEDDEEDEEDDEEDNEDEEDDEEDEEESKKIEIDDDEEDVFEIEIDDTDYFTNDETNGSIYKVDENGAPGKKIGHLKDGEPFFY